MSVNRGMLWAAACAGLALGAFLPSAAASWAEPSSTLTGPPINQVGGKALKDWIADLSHEDPSVREEAIRAIPYFGAAASQAVPALMKHINDPDESPRAKAILTLGMVPIDDEKERDKVIKALGQRLEVEGQGPIRYDIAEVLVGFGKESRLAMDGLLHGAGDPTCWEVRRICLAALVTAGQTDHGPDPRATHALIAAVRDDEPAAAVRLEGVMGLAQMGRSADPQLLAHEVAVVRNRMKDRDKTVVIWAHLSMMGLDKLDDEDIKYLTDAAKPGELERYRVQAIGALGMVGSKEKKVVPTLVDFLGERESPTIVGAACQALGTVGDPGLAAVQGVIAVARNEKFDEPIRFQAIYALAAISAKDKSALAALIGLLADKDPSVVMTAIHAIGSLEEPGASAEQALVDLTRNANVSETVRKYAQKILDSLSKPKK